MKARKIILESFREISREPLYMLYAALLLAALAKQWFNYSGYTDSIEFLRHAHTGSAFDPQHPNVLDITRRTHGYPLLLALMGTKIYAMLGVQVLAALAMPILSATLAKIMHPNYRKRLLLLGWLLLPVHFIYATSIISEIWVALLLLLGAIYFFCGNHSALTWFWMGLILLKPLFLLLFPFWLCYSWFQKISLLEKLTLSLPLMPIALIFYMQYATTGVWHYSSMGVQNAYSYNAYIALEKAIGKESADQYYFQLAEKEKKLDSFFKKKYEFQKKEAIKIVAQYPLSYAWVHAKGMVAMLLDPGRFDVANFFHLQKNQGLAGIKFGGTTGNFAYWEWGYIIIFFMIGAMRWVALLFIFLRNIALRKAIFMWLLLVIAMAGLTGPVGSMRYFYPLIPIMLAIIAAGMGAIKNSEVK